MQIPELRDRLSSRLIEFVWGQWSQMGIATAPTRSDEWAADPEALLLLAFEVARNEPRLFDEVFDWLVVNERLVSVQRLRNLCLDDSDRALVGATIAALGRVRKRQRLRWKRPDDVRLTPEPFYRHLNPQVADPDPQFLEFGFLKPPAVPSGVQVRPISSPRSTSHFGCAACWASVLVPK